MVFIKLTAQKNIHESIPNMRFKHIGWLRLSLAEAETEKTPNPGVLWTILIMKKHPMIVLAILITSKNLNTVTTSENSE